MTVSPYEVAAVDTATSRFILTCEHASNTLPPGVEITQRDRVILEQHWGWDIGARDVTWALSETLGAAAVAATFSRLWADPNRPFTDPAFVVDSIDGDPISFNQDLSGGERRHRNEWTESYHRAVDAVGKGVRDAHADAMVVAIHSFTPMYRGVRRPMEVGVLFDEHEPRARRLAEALAAQGFQVALNEPYSGRGDGALIYSAQRHGHNLGIEYLELEIRQDLIDTPEQARVIGERIASALKRAF